MIDYIICDDFDDDEDLSVPKRSGDFTFNTDKIEDAIIVEDLGADLERGITISPTGTGKPRVVGMIGGGGQGKTTFAQ